MADLDPVQDEEGVEGEAVAGGEQRPAPERTDDHGVYGGDGGVRAGRADRVGSGLVVARVVATGLGALVLVCSLWAGEWLEARSGFVFFLAVATVVALWWSPRVARAASLWAAAFALVMVAVLVSGLGRTPGYPGPGSQGPEVAGLRTGEVPTGPVLGRVADSDLPPTVGYVAGVAAVALAAVVVALAVLHPVARRRSSAAPTPMVLAVGLLVIAVAAPVVVAAGAAARTTADRWAEADSLLHETTRPAERLADSPGPVAPSTRRWEVSWPERYRSELQFSAVADVPGWDAMVGYVRSPSSVVAFSKTDGSEQWRYGRRGGLIGGITVDPEAGRVLVLSGRAAVVLDLRDGAELLVRPLPFAVRAPGVPDGGWLTGPGFLGHFGEGGPMVTVGSSAVVAGATLDVVEVASGEVLSSGEDTADCRYRRYAADTSTTTPVLVRWGLAEGPATCGHPELLRLDGEGGIDVVTEIAPPAGAAVVPACFSADCGRLIVTDDAIVLFLQWWTPDESVASEHVVLSRDGAIRWRTPLDTDNASHGLAAVTETGLITWVSPWCAPPCEAPEGHWRLLSLADGTELARQPMTDGGSELTAVDSERFYVAGWEGVTVRRLDDLSPVGTRTPVVLRGQLFATSGLLIGIDEDTHSTVGYTDDPAD